MDIPFGQQTNPQETSNKNIELLWGVRIPMRDGICLNATLYKPKTESTTPAVFTLTPYIADSYHPRAKYFVENGYAYLLIDSRGRGNSEGVFEPFVNEGCDGHDIVEWIACQSWCNGSVAMWGGSYGGFNQWMALKEFPSHLKSIVPVASAHAGVDFPFINNIFFSYEMQWLTLVSGVTGNSNLFSEQSFWIEKYRELFLEHRPFKELDRVIGNLTSCYQTWIKHPTPDQYWDRMSLIPEDYERIRIPILTITGYYDDDQPGAMHYYQMHMRHGSPEGISQHYLVIGPWDHAGTRTPSQEFGGLKFSDACLLDMNKLHKEWYDWCLKDGAKPDFLKKRVAYYLMGADEWKYADSLETIPSKTQKLFLNSTGGYAEDVFHSGTLENQPPVSSQPDHFTYDPLDIRPAEMEREEIKNYLTDQRYDLNLFGSGLVYHTAPFDEPVEITGYVKLIVWISMDVPDTDLMVTLSEILLDGSRVQLTQDFLRTRYRNSLTKEELVNAGAIERYEFDDFMFFSRRINKASRLRLVIKSPNSIYIQKNYNSGGVVAEESAKDAQTAHITLYHQLEYPSCLEIPLVC